MSKKSPADRTLAMGFFVISIILCIGIAAIIFSINKLKTVEASEHPSPTATKQEIVVLYQLMPSPNEVDWGNYAVLTIKDPKEISNLGIKEAIESGDHLYYFSLKVGGDRAVIFRPSQQKIIHDELVKKP